MSKLLLINLTVLIIALSLIASSCCRSKMNDHEKLYVDVANNMHIHEKHLLRLGHLKKGSLAADYMRMDYESLKFKYKMSDFEMDRLSIFFDRCCQLSYQLDSIDMEFEEFKKAQKNLDFRRSHSNIDYSFLNAIN